MKSSPVASPASAAPIGTGALERQLEPEVMDSELEAMDYDAMDHGEVNSRFAADLILRRPDLSRSLDIGTGTALIPIELCRRERSARVLGIDLAVHMLHRGARNVEQAGLSGVITLERRDAKALGLADATFSTVFSNSIVHHIPEPREALAEMVRVLSPSGWLFVRDLVRPRDESTLLRLVEQYAKGANPRQRALFDASLRAALSFDEALRLAQSLGIPPDAVAQTSDRHITLAWNKP